MPAEVVSRSWIAPVLASVRHGHGSYACSVNNTSYIWIADPGSVISRDPVPVRMWGESGFRDGRGRTGDEPERPLDGFEVHGAHHRVVPRFGIVTEGRIEHA